MSTSKKPVPAPDKSVRAAFDSILPTSSLRIQMPPVKPPAPPQKPTVSGKK